MTCRELAIRLGRHRFRCRTEKELQASIGTVFRELGLDHRREFRLSDTDVPDFIVDCDGIDVAVEVKVGGSATDLTRQVAYYAEYDVVDEVLVVTTRRLHFDLPDAIVGKPVHVCVVNPFL